MYNLWVYLLACVGALAVCGFCGGMVGCILGGILHRKKLDGNIFGWIFGAIIGGTVGIWTVLH